MSQICGYSTVKPAVDFTRRIYGYLEQIGALALTVIIAGAFRSLHMVCVLCQESSSRTGADTFTSFRGGSRILSLRHGSEPNQVTLYRASLMPTREAETFFQHHEAHQKHQRQRLVFVEKANSETQRMRQPQMADDVNALWSMRDVLEKCFQQGGVCIANTMMCAQNERS